MVSCIGCTNKSFKTKDLGIKYYRFPKNPRQFKAWVRALRRKNWTPSPHARLCSAHFEEKYFLLDGSKRLIDNAVPTMFPFNKRHLYVENIAVALGPTGRPVRRAAMQNILCPPSRPVETPPMSGPNTETDGVVQNIGGFADASPGSLLFTPLVFINPNTINCTQEQTIMEYPLGSAGSSYSPGETTPVPNINTYTIMEYALGRAVSSHNPSKTTPVPNINTHTIMDYTLGGAGLSYSPAETPTVPNITTHSIMEYTLGGALSSHNPGETPSLSNVITHTIRRTEEVGEQHNYAVMASPRTLKRTIDELCDKLMSYRTELKKANKSIYRLRTKVSYLTSVVQSLREEESPH